MSLFTDLSGAARGLFKRLPGSDNPEPIENKSLSDVPKVGFQGTTESPADFTGAKASGRSFKAPAAAAPGFPSRGVGSEFPRDEEGVSSPGHNDLSRFTEMSPEVIDDRLQAVGSAFYLKYGLDAPESTLMAIATNPNIPKGAIGELFSDNPNVVRSMGKLFKGAEASAFAESSLGRFDNLGPDKNHAPFLSMLEDTVKESEVYHSLEPGGAAHTVGKYWLENISIASIGYKHKEAEELLKKAGVSSQPLPEGEFVDPDRIMGIGSATSFNLSEEQKAKLTPKENERLQEIAISNQNDMLEFVTFSGGVSDKVAKAVKKASKLTNKAIKLGDKADALEDIAGTAVERLNASKARAAADKAMEVAEGALKASEALAGTIVAKSKEAVTGAARKTSGLAKTLRENVADMIDIDFGDLPDYQVGDSLKAADEAMDFVKKFPELAKGVLSGKNSPTELPKNMLVGHVYSASVVDAAGKGDTQALYDLVHSKAANDVATRLGRGVQAFDTGLANNPVKKLKEVVKERISKIKGRKGRRGEEEVAHVADQLKETVTKNAKTNTDEAVEEVVRKAEADMDFAKDTLDEAIMMRANAEEVIAKGKGVPASDLATAKKDLARAHETIGELSQKRRVADATKAAAEETKGVARKAKNETGNKAAKEAAEKLTPEEKLANKVIKEVSPEEAKNLTPEQLKDKQVNELVDELFRVAKETLPEKGKKKAEPIIARIQRMFAQDKEAGRVYGEAKELVDKGIREKFKDNPALMKNMLDNLVEYEGKALVAPVAKKTVTKAVREELKKRKVDLKRIVTELSQEGQDATKKGIAKAMSNEGFSPEAAEQFGKMAEDEIGIQMAKKKTDILKQMVSATKPKNKVAIEDAIAKMSNLGALTDPDYLALSRKMLGADVTLAETEAVAKLSASLTKATAALTKKLPDGTIKRAVNGSPESVAYGRAKVDLLTLVSDLKNPTNKMGLVEQIKNVDVLDTLNPRSWVANVGDVAGLAKALKATADNSFVGRQGRKLMASNPKRWAKLTLKSFDDIAKSFGGKEVYNETLADVLSRQRAIDGFYDDMGLAVGVIEEDLPTRIHEKIPYLGRIFKASDEAFSSFALRARADTADMLLDIAERNGEKMDAKWLKGTGRYVNSLTSRGYLGEGGEEISGFLNKVFFSVRNQKAHLDFITAHLADPAVPAFAKKRALVDLTSYLGQSAAVIMTARAMGADVELDPLSADLGDIRIGEKRIGHLGGMGSIVTLGARMTAWGQSFWDEDLPLYKSSSSGEVSTRADFKSKTGEDVVVDFSRNKLAPVGSMIGNFLRGKDFNNQPISVGSEIANLFTPIPVESWEDLRDSPDSENKLLTALAMGLEEVGFDVSSYTAPDNPLHIENRLWETDMQAKKPDGSFVMTSDQKFNARFKWREEIRPEILRLAKQRNVVASAGWGKFLEEWDIRNGNLKATNISPDSSKFNEEAWEKELIQIFKDYPTFKKQYKALPKKLLLR